MACPSTNQLSGSGVVNVGFFTSRPVAEREAMSLLPSRADIEAGLAFNAYHCAEKCCRKKTLGVVATTVTSKDTIWSPVASLFYWEIRYRGKVIFDWTAPVTCSNSCSEIAKAFIDEFTRAVNERLREFDNPFLWFEGWSGNLFSWVGWGEGCAAWADWVLSWLTRSGWRERAVRVRFCHYWKGPFKHQVVIIELADGSKLVLDPWRGTASPVWEQDEYEREFEKLVCED